MTLPKPYTDAELDGCTVTDLKLGYQALRSAFEMILDGRRLDRDALRVAIAVRDDARRESQRLLDELRALKPQVFEPGQRVEVLENGQWVAAVILSVMDFNGKKSYGVKGDAIKRYVDGAFYTSPENPDAHEVNDAVVPAQNVRCVEMDGGAKEELT